MFRHSRHVIVLLAFAFAIPLALAQAASKPDIKPDYSKEAFVVEQTSTRIVFENDGTSTREQTARVRIQSDAGVQRYGLLTFSYQGSTESLDIDYVRVRKPDGSVVPTPAENTQDMPSEITREAPFYSDLREKHVAVKGLSVGDVLEYQSHWRGTKPLAPGQFWFAYNFSHDGIILQEQLQISVPRDRPVKWNSPDVKPAITEETARRVFTWTTSQLEHKSSEDQKAEQETKLYQAARGKFPPADVQISSFQTWEEVGQWYGSLQQERVKPTPEIRARAAELTKGMTDDNAKLHAIYKYVSTNFRYIGIAFGIGRYQPHTAAEVLSNQYGDCKDKYTLFASLLDAAGIKAYPALISSSHEIDVEVPSPGQFDHVIGAVPQGSGFQWFDTTIEVAPFAYLLTQLRDKRALVIADGKPPALVTTPANPPSKASQTFKITAKLDDNGTLEGKIERTVQGDDNEVFLRAAFRRVPMPQWKDLVQQISYGSGFAGDVSEVTASSPEKTDEPFHFAYTYQRKDYPNWSERKVSSPIPPLLAPASDTKPSHPVFLAEAGEIQYESRVELPKGYSPDLPGTVDLKQDFADYHASYTVKDGVLITERHFVVKLREVPLSEYDAYRKFAKSVSDDHERYVALSSGVAPNDASEIAIQSLPKSGNTEAMLNEARALEAIKRHDPHTAIDLLQDAVKDDPKFVRAWVELGDLLMAPNLEAGLDALHRAIELAPTHPVPRRILAEALMRMGRSEDAISIWQNLTEIAPDGETFTGLGVALSDIQQYESAAYAFRAAAEYDPTSPDVQVKLGAAYLQAGNKENGIAALKKAIELDSKPDILNAVAFSLANASQDLPEALEYARRAVNEEEQASLKIDFTQLRMEDVQRTQQLGTYWDTLGWVYFHLGKLDEAEKYLKASWFLSQTGTVGDHLGQLYEEKADKQAAIHVYQLALGTSTNASGGSPTMPQTRARLDRLLVTEPAIMKGGDADLGGMRTVHLDRLVPGSASAVFFLVFTAGPKVENVKFVSGSEQLKSAGAALMSAKFDLPFPDDGPTRIVRRGLLMCFPSTGCSFVLVTPDSVNSLD